MNSVLAKCPGAGGPDAALDPYAQQREVAQQVEQLVARQLVVAAQFEVIEVARLDLDVGLVEDLLELVPAGRSGTGFSTTTMALSRSPPLIRFMLISGSSSCRKTNVRQGEIFRAKSSPGLKVAYWLPMTFEL